MAWLVPPPTSQKPLHPLRGLPRPPRMLASYIIGILLWNGVTHLMYALVLVVRYLLARHASLWPTWFWIGEWITWILGAWVGLWTTTLILIQLSLKKIHPRSAARYDTPTPPDRL